MVETRARVVIAIGVLVVGGLSGYSIAANESRGSRVVTYVSPLTQLGANDSGPSRLIPTTRPAGPSSTVESANTISTTTSTPTTSSVTTTQPPTTALPSSTALPASCDPNYTGACVPIASDVDCAGGSGNGPAYVGGPVTVIGSDIYGLDRDGDRIGCE